MTGIAIAIVALIVVGLLAWLGNKVLAVSSTRRAYLQSAHALQHEFEQRLKLTRDLIAAVKKVAPREVEAVRLLETSARDFEQAASPDAKSETARYLTGAVKTVAYIVSEDEEEVELGLLTPAQKRRRAVFEELFADITRSESSLAYAWQVYQDRLLDFEDALREPKNQTVVSLLNLRMTYLQGLAPTRSSGRS